jgi:hypothetical protein
MDLYPNANIGCDVGVVVNCEGGTVITANGPPLFKSSSPIAHRTDGSVAYDLQGRIAKRFSPMVEGKELMTAHVGNFLAAVRSRKQDSLAAPIECGHRSSSLCHVSNISYRVGQGRPPEAIREQIGGNPAMTEATGRMLEHLGANGVVLAADSLHLGLPLAADPSGERFIGNDAANELLTRRYRPPFVVPAMA